MSLHFKYCRRGEQCVHPSGPFLQPFDFHKDSSRRNGLASYCKACVKKYCQDNSERLSENSRQWRVENQERFNEYHRQYHQEHPRPYSGETESHKRYRQENWDKVYATQKKWRAKNPDKRKEQDRRYRERHPGRHVRKIYKYRYRPNSEKDRQRSRQYRQNNLEKVRERERRYRQENQDKRRAQAQRRRAKRIDLPAHFTAFDEARALEYFNGRCAVCERPLRDLFGEISPHFDHWIALSDPRLGNPGTVPENMLPLCNKCNLSKSNHDPIEWLTRQYHKRKVEQIIKRIETFFEWVKQQ